jgi:hypothetical protein
MKFSPFYMCDRCDPQDIDCSSCEGGDLEAGKDGFLPPSMAAFDNWQHKFQTIYRFAYRNLTSTQTPIKYIEVDYNTEGKKRGPNGAFIQPHFDFHM